MELYFNDLGLGSYITGWTWDDKLVIRHIYRLFNGLKIVLMFEGFNLLFDQVSVQGKPDSNRSVSQYYLKTSTDNISFNGIQEGGRMKVNYYIIPN